ncbi:MAG: hypothetical protein IPK58_15010 [Acidobacteria bacterium]|nr:hypothetical protein [Acidobacteriota bacterium]
MASTFGNSVRAATTHPMFQTMELWFFTADLVTLKEFFLLAAMAAKRGCFAKMPNMPDQISYPDFFRRRESKIADLTH